MDNKESISYLKIISVYSGWWAVWLSGQVYLFHSWGWNWEVALAEAGVTQLSLAVAGFAMNTSLRYYRPNQKSIVYILIWSLMMAGLVVGAQQWALVGWFGNQPAYLTFLDQSTVMRYLFDWLMISFVSMMSWLWFYWREQQESERRKAHADQLVRDAELSSLRQQMQPHFLFNSLNSISALVGSKPEEARKMVQQLSDFLRGTLKKEDRQMVALEEELKHLQLYLDIEKVRFGHRLQTRITYADTLSQMRLPSLLIQPVVENAIKFGLYDTIGEIIISVEAKQEQGMLVMEVRNPFDPATSSARHGTGFGLSSIQRRLYLLFSRNDLLNTIQDKSTFITIIKIPQLA
jgi:two-component system, LytTR family, sensor kinase